MDQHEVRNFKYGTINALEKQSIPDGAASSSLNWVTRGDKIELRRGQRLIGTDQGAGGITGLGVARRLDGTEVMWGTHGRKIVYYDEATEDWIEAGSNVLPVAADGEEISMTPYQSLAGTFMLMSSPNSSIYKIPVANPGSVVDLQSTTYRGKIKAKTGRLRLWDRKDATGGQDKTGLYLSYIDRDEISDYTEVTNENRHNGDGSTLTFTGTLDFKSGNSKRTCLRVRITDGTETLTDDGNGVLVGSAGGTGTINYATGAYSATFAVAPIVGVNNVKANYYHEDSTDHGVADFTYSIPRTVGQGNFLRQDDGGGPFQNLFDYNSAEFCLHQFKTWVVALGTDGEPNSNLVFRDLVGIPNWRAAVATGEGIYYVDARDSSNPKFRLLTLDAISAQVIPKPISDSLNLAGYEFDLAVVEVIGDYVTWECRTANSETNDTTFVYERRLKVWDRLDYIVSCKAVYNSALVGGDVATNNVYELFSGTDDDDSEIPNYWEGNLSRLEIAELKKVKRLHLQGEIGPEQSIDVYLNLDRGGYVLVGTIDGDGDYIDRTERVYVGAPVLGSTEIGGGSDGIEAYNYVRELSLRLDKFDECQIKFVATGLGYASVSMYRFFDIRRKDQKLPSKYRS